MATATAHARESRAACESAFAFLADEFGYRRCVRRFRYGGFELGYCGPGIGVLVEWYPRDSLLVWLVVLVDDQFPPRSNPANFGEPSRYFDLADLEAVMAQPSAVDQRDLYGATASAAHALAGSLRACGTNLLRGDLTLIPALEQRIRDRVRRSRWPGKDQQEE